MKRYTAFSTPFFALSRRLGALLAVATLSACSSGGGGSSSAGDSSLSGDNAPVTAESLQGTWLFCYGDGVYVLTAQGNTLSADPQLGDGGSSYDGTYHQMSGLFDPATRLWTPDYFDETGMNAPDGAPLENDFPGEVAVTFDVTGTRFVGTGLDVVNFTEVPLLGGRDDGSFDCTSSSSGSSSKCSGTPRDCEDQEPGYCMNGCNLVLGVYSMPNSCSGSPEPCDQLGEQNLCVQAGCQWTP
jgi:hypothetical protein